MEWNFFQAALAGGGVTTALLAIAGFLGRSQLSHWLNKDIERIKAQFQRDLQRDKASFERELEAYKVSLIAEAERAKAAQSVRTAGALKMMEHKFDVLTELFKAVREYASNSISYCSLTYPILEIYVAHQTAMTEQMRRAGTAIEAVAPFIPLAEYQQLLGLHNVVIGAIRRRAEADVPLQPERLEEFKQQVIPMQAGVNAILQRHITGMFDVA